MPDAHPKDEAIDEGRLVISRTAIFTFPQLFDRDFFERLRNI